MNYRACKDCIYFAKHYGNKDSRGKRAVSNYWCVEKQGFLKSFPKQCQKKRTREDVRNEL